MSTADRRVGHGLVPGVRTGATRGGRQRGGRGTTATDQRGEAYIAQVLDNLASVAPGGRNAALNHAAWTLARWVAAGVLSQGEVEDALYAAAEANGLVANDGPRRCWATIRSGLSKGLLQPVDLDTDEWSPSPRPRRRRRRDQL